MIVNCLQRLVTMITILKIAVSRCIKINSKITVMSMATFTIFKLIGPANTGISVSTLKTG